MEPAASRPEPAAPPPGSIAEFGERLQEAIDRWELSDAERDCLLESGESPEAVASRSSVDYATARAVFASGLARCLPDTILLAKFGSETDDLGDLSEAELSCARQWLAGRGGEAFGAAYAGDGAAYREYNVGLLGCVPSDFLAGLFDPEGEDWGHVSESELSCAQQWLLGADRDLLGAMVSGDPVATAEYRLGLARCFPGMFVAAVFDMEVADLSVEQLSCIQQWLSGVDVDVVGTASTGDDWEDLAFGLGAVKCIPDSFLGAMVADWGMDVGDLTGNELSCLRELVVRIDVGALEALRTGEGPMATVFGLGLARCVPDLLLGEMVAALGLDVGDLTGHEMTCLRGWVAGLDLGTVEAAAAGDEAAAAALDLGLIACAGDRIPLEGGGGWVDWGSA